MADDNDNENENGEEPKLLGDISGVLQDVFADLFHPPEPEPEEGEDENGEQKDDAEKQTEAEEPVDEKGPEETEAKDDGAEKNNALSESGDPATGLLHNIYCDIQMQCAYNAQRNFFFGRSG